MKAAVKETVKTTNRMNGVDLDILMETVNAIKADPELGASRFRARNTWLGGNHNRSTVKSFYGAKQEIEHKQTFRMDADEPPILAGNDEGANPVEHLLHALASCLTTSLVAHAAVRGIEVEELESGGSVAAGEHEYPGGERGTGFREDNKRNFLTDKLNLGASRRHRGRSLIEHTGDRIADSWS